MPEDDPFQLWSQDKDAPREDDQHRGPVLFHETEGANGKVVVQIFPSPIARQSAAIVGGQFLALRDVCDADGEPVFSREEAFKIVIESMSAVVVHHDHGDDDEDE